VNNNNTQAYGGDAFQTNDGGAGTIYIKDQGSAYGTFYADSTVYSNYNYTPLPWSAGTYEYDDFIV